MISDDVKVNDSESYLRTCHNCCSNPLDYFEDEQELALPSPFQPSLKRHSHTLSDEGKNDSELNLVEDDIYGASRFGGLANT